MQGDLIQTDFYLLPLEGGDVVLGTQWLCTLGNIEYDFSKLLIKFELYDTIISLQGLKSTEDTVVGDQEIHKLTLTKGVLLKLVPMGKKGEVQQETSPTSAVDSAKI